MTKEKGIGKPQNQYPMSPRNVTLCEVFLPHFISPVIFNVQHTQAEAMYAKAFILPDENLRNALLKCYVQFVHPFLPVLNLHHFLDAIDKNLPSRSGVSLLIFQAVMVAAIPFVDIQLLASRGFASRKEARAVFLERANLIYTFKLESDPIALSQACLIMMTSEKPYSAWRLLRDSISIIHGLELHSHSAASGLSKRLWWTCYVRDRIQSHYMGVPLLIDGDDFEIGFLCLDDMEIDTLPSELLHMLDTSPDEVSDSLYLAQAYVELVQCCRAISRILAYRSPPDITQPRPRMIDSAVVIGCDIALECWFRDLPPQVTWADWTTRDYLNKNCSKSLRVHRALLVGLYSSFHSTLHCLQMGVSQAVNVELRDLAEARIIRSALVISEIIHDLRRHEDILFLPELAVPVLAPAISTHFAYLELISSSNRDRSHDHLQSCIAVLQELREVHSSADARYRLLEKALIQNVPRLSNSPLWPGTISVPVEDSRLGTEKGPIRGSQDLSGPEPDTVSLAITKPAAAAAYILDHTTMTDWEKQLILSLADTAASMDTDVYSEGTNHFSHTDNPVALPPRTTSLCNTIVQPSSSCYISNDTGAQDSEFYSAVVSAPDHLGENDPQNWSWEMWCERLGVLMCDSEAQIRNILEPILIPEGSNPNQNI